MQLAGRKQTIGKQSSHGICKRIPPLFLGKTMTDYEWVQCPECGWTRRTSELDSTKAALNCPVCEAHIAIE